MRTCIIGGATFDSLGVKRNEGYRDPAAAANDDPVEVGAVQTGKGKAKAEIRPRGVRGESKTRGKQNISSPGAGKGSQQPRPEPFRSECHYAGIWGHNRVDCRRRQADSHRNGGQQTAVVTPSVSSTSGSAMGSVPRVHAGPATIPEDEADDDGAMPRILSVSAATSGDTDMESGFIVDSGSNEHVCPPGCGGGSSQRKDGSRRKTLFDVQGRKLSVTSSRRILATIGPEKRSKRTY